MLARAMQPALERLNRKPEARRGLWRGQPLDIAQQDDLAVIRFEARQCIGQELLDLPRRRVVLRGSSRVCQGWQHLCQVLLVVRADSTEQRVVNEALALIDRNRPVSAILNRIEPSLVSRYYNHYYYGYGKGSAS